ncbi:MAG TPA: hypothetical protein DCZ95_00795 [Verrucomicrobia bacterium]|nr:MAG: hypothetical protein A2X46_16810 [Lentisphaerae bacterium GWF2_57_35]HBA82606.1 hypothetical protein [Verrucomicrobiota bacterium]
MAFLLGTLTVFDASAMQIFIQTLTGRTLTLDVEAEAEPVVDTAPPESSPYPKERSTDLSPNRKWVHLDTASAHMNKNPRPYGRSYVAVGVSRWFLSSARR